MKRIEVRFVNASLALVSGHGSREALTEQTGRAPVWATISRGWCCQPRTARNLIALLESRGYDVTITEGDPLPAVRGLLW